MTDRLTRHNGAALRAFRVKAGLKTAELAAQARSSYSQVDNLENERKEASIELLHRLASVLDVPTVALVRDPSYVIHASDRASA